MLFFIIPLVRSLGRCAFAKRPFFGSQIETSCVEAFAHNLSQRNPFSMTRTRTLSAINVNHDAAPNLSCEQLRCDFHHFTEADFTTDQRQQRAIKVRSEPGPGLDPVST
ncbi:MAG: hypothetical protein K0R45_2582, partial [Pseudomonas sp.]|nr:hypothetical protein [Pseudomonas sp.]